MFKAGELQSVLLVKHEMLKPMPENNKKIWNSCNAFRLILFKASSNK